LALFALPEDRIGAAEVDVGGVHVAESFVSHVFFVRMLVMVGG
jgi:hypothetical protein